MAHEKDKHPELTPPRVESVEPVSDSYRTDEELDAKFGDRQAPKVHSSERLLDEKLSKPPVTRTDDNDIRIDCCDWVKKHFNRLAGKDVGAEVHYDEWDNDIIHVKVKSKTGTMSRAGIEGHRRTRSLEVIDREMQTALSCFAPEFKAHP